MRARSQGRAIGRFGLGALGLALCACAFWTGAAHAQPLVAVEAGGGLPLGAPQSDWFGVGGALGASVYAPLHPNLLLGVTLRVGALSDGGAPRDRSLADPRAGTFETLAVALRIRPLGTPADTRYGLGLFVEAGVGGAHTGDLLRPAFEASAGYGFPLGAFGLAPVVRYAQVVQPSDPFSSADARMLLVGAELTLIDGRRREAARTTGATQARVLDADGDRILDASDRCPAEPEDHDGFEDVEGCPDPDNDRDKIMDAVDRCPDEAEDKDAFDDEDGCPETDNDADGFLDGDDQCPNEAEVINGNKDYDGCKDEGLFELRGDRIVLEEQVLFDFERARVRTAAKAVLDAIVKLYKQHPEWTRIHIEGHADARGDATFNDELSQRRAENVMRELIRAGVPEDTIDCAGYGSSRPRDKRTEEDAHRRNRRVEFVVTTALPGTTGAAAPAEPGPLMQLKHKAPTAPPAGTTP